MSIKRSLLSVPFRFCNMALIFSFLLLGINAFAADPEVSDSEDAIKAGESLFNANCKTCHKLDQKFTGPALRGVSAVPGPRPSSGRRYCRIHSQE